jgi:DNA-binding transcriptional MerR regulator
MQLTLGQAAKAVGMNKATLSRYIKQGKISAEKQEDGSYRIDPSELDRLQEMRITDTLPPQPLVTPGELALMRELLAEKDRLIANLTAERDEWREQAKRQILLLSAPQEQPKRKRWWPF